MATTKKTWMLGCRKEGFGEILEFIQTLPNLYHRMVSFLRQVSHQLQDMLNICIMVMMEVGMLSRSSNKDI